MFESDDERLYRQQKNYVNNPFYTKSKQEMAEIRNQYDLEREEFEADKKFFEEREAMQGERQAMMLEMEKFEREKAELAARKRQLEATEAGLPNTLTPAVPGEGADIDINDYQYG